MNENKNPNTEDYSRVDGWNWRDIVDTFNLDLGRFLHLFSLHPDMINESEGYKRKMQDNRFKFIGQDCVFDRQFVIEKLFNLFTQLECYDTEAVDLIMEEVKVKISKQQQQAQTEKIERINQLAKELGLTKKELTAQIKV